MTAAAPGPSLSWLGIVRLGLVQTALGAVFVLATSTLNRVMVIELALPAALPGLLIGLHYLMQVLRPRLGHGSDVSRRSTPWIIGGMAVLALGGIGAATGTALMARSLLAGLAIVVPSFCCIGLGVGAAGTSLLVLLAKQTAPARRPAAATIAWVMMIVGFILTASIAGRFLDPFSPGRLIAVATAISCGAWIVSCLAVWGLEVPAQSGRSAGEGADFRRALREVWDDARARRFAIFIFVSMLAYGGEDLLIEPFAGAIFGQTPGATAKLSGLLHAGSLIGMLLVGVSSALPRLRARSLQPWMIGGCLASGAALLALAGCGLAHATLLLRPAVFTLGASNGAYAIAAIGSMMQLVGGNAPGREGIRMGLWGSAQAVAFGGGGLAATILSDVARHVLAAPPWAYAVIFACEATVFTYAATLAGRLDRTPRKEPRPTIRSAVPIRG